jgi:L-rhamnose isomerase
MFETIPAKEVRQRYRLAKRAYARMGVDADAAIATALRMPLSLHCWQADDVAGFEVKEGVSAGGGIMATGNYPGRARTPEEMRSDIDQVLRLLPGRHRFNLHASYADTGGRVVDRDAVRPAHFASWIDWARKRRIGLDFNTTFYAHPLANDGFTLSHPDAKVRRFWIRHAIACRRIAEHIGRTLKNPCILNHWLPDGEKDAPADRWSPRERLVAAFDEILSPKQRVNRTWCVDAVEGKLFGLGSEEYVVGSNEFYAHYALTRKVLLTLDMGHFHPTETIHDKVSALLQFHPRLLLHVSRPIRWDSDHVVILNDDLRNLFHEIVRGRALGRVALALDFFDASINRVEAYVVGARATRKALLIALLEPAALLRAFEGRGERGERLALMEEMKSMPFGAAWDMLCLKARTPVGAAWIDDARRYEERVLRRRR